MDVPAPRDDADPLAQPVRAGLFAALTELRRSATTAELARRLDRHPNGIRRHLERLADAGLVVRGRVPQARGRPQDGWSVAPGARPGGAPPDGYRALSGWLARAVGRGGGIDVVEAVGREIGGELAPDDADPDPGVAMGQVLTSLGFQPRRDATAADRACFVLGNCPYRDVVSEQQPTVCALHRGITRGVLDRLAPRAELVAFVPKDPYAAGCVVDIALTAATP